MIVLPNMRCLCAVLGGGRGPGGGASPENTSKYFIYTYGLSAGFVEGFGINIIVKGGGGRVKPTALFLPDCQLLSGLSLFLFMLVLSLFNIDFISVFIFCSFNCACSLYIYNNHLVYLYSFIAAYFFSGWSVSAYCTI